MPSCPRFPVTDLEAALVRMPVFGILRGCPPQYVYDMVTAAKDADFLEAGSTAIGVSGAVFPRTVLESGDAAEVERRCRSLVAAIR